jgi:hypothetical protein
MTERPPTIAKTSYRLTAESKRLLAALAKQQRRSMTKVLEVLIEEAAKKARIT